MSFHGVWTALITPFHKDGTLDLESWDQLLQRQRQASLRGVVVCGTTGEAPTLSVSEKLSLIKRAKATLGSDMEIMAGCGGWDTAQTIELSKLCVEAGAQSLLIVTPPYNKPPIEGLKQHYYKICESVGAPVVVYHVPGRTGQALSVSEMKQLLAVHPGIKAIKEASSDPILLSRYILESQNSVSEDFSWLSGNDVSFLAEMAMGACGVVSVLSNVLPHALKQLYEHHTEKNTSQALALNQALLPLTEALFWQSNPIPTKALLKAIDVLPCEHLRLPLVPLAPHLRANLLETYHKTKEKLTALGVGV